MRAKLLLSAITVTAIVLVAACNEAPHEQSALVAPDLMLGGSAKCPLPADYVANNEPELLAALAAAGPGDVIGLDSLITIQSGVVITVEDLTLTCAKSGSGLRAAPGMGVGDLISARADGVTIDRLVLEGSEASGGPFFAWRVEGVRFSNNTVTCGPTYCAFFVATPLARVEDNYFESHGSLTGVHMQNRADSVIVSGNTLVATSPSFNVEFAAIRVLRGSNVTVRRNEVSGPWQNSISGSNLSAPRINDNSLADAVWDGILLVAVDSGVVRNNRAINAGEAGIWAGLACDNTFLGNNLSGNNNDWGLYFHPWTGANTLVGNLNIVIDNGYYDCNDDGAVDPNIITGQGAVISGVNLGKEISDSASLDKEPS